MEFYFILLLCCLNVYGQLDVTIFPQEDYNAALNPDSKVNFNCTAFVANIEFRLNDTLAGNFIVSRGVAVTGVEPVGDELFVITVSIPAREENDNTSVLCRAIDTSNIQNIVVEDSRIIFLRIQGFLDAPSNLTISETDEQLSRVLTWNPPKTLDITNVDPDIEFYQVCYNLSAELNCTNVSSVEERKFKFSNVRVPLLFTVTAFNVVGEGNESSIVHQPSNCDNVRVPSNISDVQSQVSLTQSGPVAAILINQSRESPGMCFCVYEVRTNTAEYGPLLPVVEYFSSDSVQLSLTIDFGLAENEMYSANITTTNNDGMEITIGTVEFSTYDVQSVNITATPGVLNLSCTFVNGSQAQSCILTVCSVEDCSLNTTVNITRNDNSLTFAKEVSRQTGTYNIGQVTEVERDGEETVIRGIALGEVVNVTDVNTTSVPSSSPSKTPPTGGVSSPNTNAGAIAGGVIVGVIVIVAIVIGAVVVVLLYRRRRKEKPLASARLSTAHLLESNETDSGKQNTLPQNNGSEKELAALGPTYATVYVDSARTTENAIPAENNHTPEGNGQQETDVKPEDSPTYPLYTEMMGNKQNQPSPRDAGSPQLPERLLSSEELEKLDLTMEDQVPEVPQQNLTEEDFKEMNLTKVSNVPAPDSDSSAPKLKTSELQSSNESLLSQGSKVPGATSGGDGPLYAELEHRKDKKISITAPDMTGVLYSEIKTDEIPPRLPKKKSRSSTNHSTSSPMRASNDSLTESVFTSTPVGTPLNTVQLENLDSYKV